MDSKEYLDIQELCNVKEVSCSCGKCVTMCERTPCLGTPTDILNLINAGHADKLLESVWLVGLPYGFPKTKMFQIDGTKGCPFFNKNKLCDLHDSGLKPTEGKLAFCETKDVKFPPSYAVAFTWRITENFGIIQQIHDKLKR